MPDRHRQWHCTPNAIHCHDDHLLAFYKTGYRADLCRMSGHAFFRCDECQPSTYFLSVFSKIDGMAVVNCYALSKESYLEWDRCDDPTPPTAELLWRVKDPEGHNFNPTWRPAR